MKIRTLKAYCVIEITDDPKEFPNFHKSKREAIKHSRSFMGHPLDNPEARGVVAECEIKIKIPEFPTVNLAQLSDYLSQYHSMPVVMDMDNPEFNAKQMEIAQSEKQKRLKNMKRNLKDR